MCCVALLAFGLGPRIALLLVWIFGDRVELAFDSWIWPLLGLFLLPWTTLMYVLVWGIGGVEGADWILIALGVVARHRHVRRPLRQGQDELLLDAAVELGSAVAEHVVAVVQTLVSRLLELQRSAQGHGLPCPSRAGQREAVTAGDH